ncbi:MAG: MFS transporter [Candidatus Saganbacteria bacterium]|nr:MFS transporter [Candidatus Saganbacteria bacterium]
MPQKNILILGLVSFFTDVASEMILSIFPLFLTAVGIGKSMIGLIEGIADMTASLVKVGGGWVSDRLGKRKLLIVCGYGISNLLKPFLAMVVLWPQILFIRFVDRIGKGIRTSPRDALIADSVAADSQGAAFGFHRAMDTLGAVVGTILASGLLFVLDRYYHLDKILQFKVVFGISIIPGIIAILIAWVFIKEIKNVPSLVKGEDREKWFSVSFALFLVVVTVYELGNFSYAFFLLRAQDLGVAIFLVPMVYLVYNLIYAFTARRFGKLSDKFGRKPVLAAGYLIFVLVCLMFAFVSNALWVWILIALYGLVSAVVNTIPRAMVADYVPSEHRATAFGVYYALLGVAALPASFMVGFLWDRVGVITAFSYGAALSLIAFLLLLFLNVPAYAKKT